ncbi:YkgJ family cysteine cluster protein [Candidatus Woesearchaeota archaeon]|nr:YkgJ family cysteine cluster protein [Candidatus Woesearchaeota archaeon]
MIPCRETKQEEAHVTASTPLQVIEHLADTPCQKHNCTKCCETGTGTALESDLPHIADTLNVPLNEVKDKYFEPVTRFHTTHWKPKMVSKPYGACVFLGKEGCSIHSVRPTGCRLASWNHHGEKLNDWFDLNYFVNKNDAQSVREWAMKLKFSKTIPGGELEALVPDKEKLRKILSHEI